MTDLMKLRAMLLLAITGCSAEPKHHRRPHRHHRAVDEDTEETARAPRDAAVDAPPPVAPKPEECDSLPDTIFEAACTEWKECEPFETLEQIDVDIAGSKLFVTEHRSPVRFVFDPDVTDRYRMAHDGVGCCYSHCTRLQVAPTATLQPKPNYITKQVFIPMPKGGTRFPSKRAPNCPAAVAFSGVDHPFGRERDEMCGYDFLERDPATVPPLGRAARVDGIPRYPDIAPDAAAQYWIDAARAEHASIAAFGNLSLQLLALGAPPGLLEATHAAALDEIRHARDAFAIASRLAGRTIEPGPFPEAARMSAQITLRALAVETFVDGCIAEACAALEASRAAREAEPSIAAVLEGVAADESRHAALAWSIVAWCCECDPAIVAVLRRRAAHEPPSGIRGEVLAIVDELLDAVAARA